MEAGRWRNGMMVGADFLLLYRNGNCILVPGEKFIGLGTYFPDGAGGASPPKNTTVRIDGPSGEVSYILNERGSSVEFRTFVDRYRQDR